MDPLGVQSVAAVRHPLEPPSPSASDEAATPHASDFHADVFAAPPLCAPLPGGALSGLPLLRALARQGTWRAVAEAAKAALAVPGTGRDVALACITYHALALTKLRMYGGAAEALSSAGDPDAAPNLDGAGRSLAPFALRWLQAELPMHLGAPGATVDALCTLHAACAAEAAAARDAASAATGARRADMALHALVALHASRRDWRAALTWLDAASRAAPGDPAPLAAAGLLFLQMGDAASGAAATDAAEAACAAAPPHAQATARAAVARNRAMLRFAAKDYAGARDAFAAVLAARPWDGVAANNAAVASLYCADLPGAVAILERALAAHPLTALHESLVLNLCSLYELSAGDAAGAKRRIASWLARAGPEDFDGMCTKL